MSRTTAPKLADLQQLAATTLAAVSYLSDAGVAVVADQGLSKRAIEASLRSPGAVVVVCPVVAGTLRDQSGPSWCLDVELMVQVVVNPETNAAAGGASIDIYRALTEVASALCGASRHPGGEFFRLSQEAISLARFDEGLFSYTMLFTKEALL